MSQSVVTVRLNGTPYQIGCGPGEEAHVAALGAEVESILQELIGAVGQIGDARLLAMVTLILADKANDAKISEAKKSDATSSDVTSNGAAPNATPDQSEDAAAAALESAAEKIANIASTLASRHATH
ncbi:cell division protein ZapA [Alphaproteobacteria bacterium]|nr:cell division protein ZapA [Alphaproteobacteria bacterium]MDB3891512.1 cell division protein ZapA [Alphaproteobacteria bacterium]